MKRGFSLVELVTAGFVACLSFIVFLSVFSKSYEHAELTRDQMIATVLARSWVAEIDAHPYGARAPVRWADGDERPATVLVAGRPEEVVFHRTLRFKNSSFIGNGTGTERSDAVTLTLTWKEKSGPKQLVVTVPVWR